MQEYSEQSQVARTVMAQSSNCNEEDVPGTLVNGMKPECLMSYICSTMSIKY